jgi:succinate dehydrogenase / fumarate reductase iron-sulfur subunit
MRVNGIEKLSCITRLRDITTDGSTVKVEPLRNFPVISDLVVDMGSMFTRMENVGAKQILSLSQAPLTEDVYPSKNGSEYNRLVDCIECGLCISACPVAATDPDYLGPAPLAAAQQNGLADDPKTVLQLVDSEEGVWRCHSAYECTAVCPSNVQPAWRIMDLRKQVIGQRIKKFFKNIATQPRRG